MWAERQPTRRPAFVSTTRAVARNEADPFKLFAEAASAGYRALWLRPDSGEALVGVGAARVLEASGPDRFATIRHAWHDLLDDAEIEGGSPRVLGGFSFDPLRPPTALWSAFPDARFVLPQRMLALKDDAAWLTTNSVARPIATAEMTRTTPAASEPMSPEAWTALVARVADGIRHARLGLEKVVLARSQHIAVPRVDPAVVVRRLAQAYPTCTVFAIEHAGVCFVGATPERLVSLHKGTASTMALAGSLARGATPDEDRALTQRLLADPKERAEHAFVVRALRDGLAADGLCTRIVADAEPRVRTLANLQHLYTPIRGQVAPGRTVLDLVQSLHPSPAVGGAPRQQALELIRAEEGLDRGWYAGALGWVDGQGEGDFVVGIRSALLQHDEATLFAGCGIVADSDAAAEYAESEWKLRPMRNALAD